MVDTRFSPYKILCHDIDRKYPIHLQVDPSGACNHHCTFCYFSSPENTGEVREEYSRNEIMSKDIIDKIVDGIVECDIKCVTLVGGGEPSLCPDFLYFIKKLNCMTIDWGIITNFYKKFSDEEIEELAHASWVRVSVDSACNETHNKIHRPVDKDPASFSRVYNNIKRLVEKGGKVGISFLIIPENVDEMVEAYNTFKNAGCIYIQFKPAVLKDKGKVLKEIEDKIKNNLAKIKDLNKGSGFIVYDQFNRNETLLHPVRSENPCQLVKYRNQITSDGKCWPCCVVKYIKNMDYGCLKNNTLKEILDSDRKKKIDAKLIPRNCAPCWDDRFNEILDFLFEKNKTDNNFV